ncbi:MAG: carbonic anhydrase family protein [Bacteroidetes bacterium]|jgi:carbonic anhydrase|nr:carbonic anhydrase family protein [Bacteroidota bacterium]MDF1868191.1 carbonic anhydrase family protein [Saprospiraceae bacterium]
MSSIDSKNQTITQTAKSQAALSPVSSVELLKKGNARFLNGAPLNRDLHQQVHQTASGQYPFATVVSCIDSRIPTEIIFDQGIGDLFNARVAGNFVNKDILGSLEFACKLAGSKVIVVMGHTSCGAVKGACDHAKLGNLTQMLDKIMPAVDAISTPDGTDRSSKNLDFVNQVAVKNVEFTIANIKSESSVLNDMFENGEIDIVGAMYDVKSGKVDFLN